MFSKHLFMLSPLLHSIAATNLYVASYAGNLTSLSLVENPDHTYNLSQITTFNTSTNAPSWLTLNRHNNILYYVDEAVNATNGTLISYKTSYTGQLTEIQRVEALAGGVHATFYGSGSAITVPHYTGSALQTYNITSTGEIFPLETITYSLNATGTVPNRQDAPHPHEAVLDPTERYILINDLGADLVHIYSIDASNRLKETPSLHAAAGSGPRHGAFSRNPISGSYIYYLAAEISSTVTAYRVTYGVDFSGLTLDVVGIYDSLGPGSSIPATTTGESTGVVAEIVVSPDGSTVIVSNRRDLSFNNTTPPSDSMSVFAISPIDGTLTFLQLFPAGGSYPRQFALNKAGNLAAVGLQMTGSVAILQRDAATGLFEEEVASLPIGNGMVTCVVWDE